ncbi:hypothetical protein G6F68_013056 [Rhizopus microsporus]|nr:hypothetical protein G6F68_013056 [Rhizopus microsporus]
MHFAFVLAAVLHVWRYPDGVLRRGQVGDAGDGDFHDARQRKIQFRPRRAVALHAGMRREVQDAAGQRIGQVAGQDGRGISQFHVGSSCEFVCFSLYTSSRTGPTLAPYPYRQDSSMTRDTPHIPARYLLFPLLAALIWSVNMIVTKMAAGVISPAVIGFYRWAIAGAVLTPCALPGVWAQRRLIVPYLPKCAVLGGLGMALYQGLAYWCCASRPR